MRVTLDVSPAVNGKAGLGRYAASLALALAEFQPGKVSLFANLIPGARWPADLNGLPRTDVRAGYKLWRMAALAGGLSGMRWDRYVPGAEVFHATEHLLIPLSPKISRVITVHDLIFKRFPEHHKRLNSLYLNTAMPLYLRQADHIIAVSHCTKSDIVNDYGIDPAKVSVIYEAAAPFFKPPSPERILDMREKFGLWGRYLVTVGTIEPRKNLNRLVQAFVILRERDPDLRLVVVGVDGWLFESFYNEIKDIHPHGTVFRPGYVTDEDLPAMIAGASCAVTPSLYEGFGLPVLEAMACGTPVVCSRTSSLGEIAGDAAVLIDPESLESLTEGLRQVLMDDDFAASLREKGLKRAAEFSWGRAARETWQVYQGPGMTR